MYHLRLLLLLTATVLPAAVIPNQPQKTTIALDGKGDPLPDGALSRIGSVRFRVPEAALAVQFAKNGSIILARTGQSHSPNAEGSIYRFDAFSGRLLGRIDAPLYKVMHPFGREGIWSVSPDGQWLAYVEEKWRERTEHYLVIVDLATGHRHMSQLFPGRSITDVQISADGKQLITAAAQDDDRANDQPVNLPILQLWDIASAKEVRAFDLPVLKGEKWQPHRLMVSPKGHFLVATGRRVKTEDRSWDEAVSTKFIWEMATGRLLPGLENGGGEGEKFTMSPDGGKMAAVVEDTIHFWDPRTGKVTGKLGKVGKPCRALEFSPDGKRLVAFTGDSRTGTDLQVWDLASGKELVLPLPESYEDASCQFSSDGRTLVIHTESDIVACEADTAKFLWKASHAFSNAFYYRDRCHGMDRPIALSPDGKTLVAGGSVGQLRRWEMSSGKEIAAPGPPTVVADYLVYSHDGQNLLAGSNAMLLLYELNGSQHSQRMTLPKIPSKKGNHIPKLSVIALSRAGKLAAAGYKEGTVAVWDTAAGKCLWQTLGPEKLPQELAFAFDDRTLIVAAANHMVVWRDAQKGTIRRSSHLQDSNDHGKNTSHNVCLTPGAVALLKYNPTSRVIEEWEMATAQKRRDTAISGSPLAVSFDRRFVLVASRKCAVLFDLIRGVELRAFYGAGKGSFSPDGRTLACAVSGGRINFCDIATGTVFGHVEGHPGGLLSFAFAPDGQSLAASCGDGTILIWKVPTRSMPQPSVLLKTQQNSLWDQLIGENPATASNALELLTRTEATIQLAKQKIAAGQADGDIGLTRIVELLERIGSKEAVELLKPLAAGRAGTWSTLQARLALENLAVTSPALVAGPLPKKDGMGETLPIGARARLRSLGKPFDTKKSVAPKGWTPQLPVVSCLASSQTGRIVAACDQTTVHVWDSQSGQLLCRVETWLSAKKTEGLLTALAVAPDGGLLAVGGSDGTILIVDVQSGKRRRSLRLHQTAVVALTWRADGVLLSADRLECAAAWNVAEGRLIRQISTSIQGEKERYWSRLKPVFSNNGQLLAVPVSGGIKIIELASGKSRTTVNPAKGLGFDRGGCESSPALSPDGRVLAVPFVYVVPSDVIIKSLSFHLYDTLTGELLRSLDGISSIEQCCFSRDGKLLAACGDGRLRIWETATGTVRADWPADHTKTTAICFAPDCQILFSAGNGGTVLVGDLATILKEAK